MPEIQVMKNKSLQPVLLTEPTGGTKFSFASFMHFKMENISAIDNLKRGEIFLFNFIFNLKNTHVTMAGKIRPLKYECQDRNGN